MLTIFAESKLVHMRRILNSFFFGARPKVCVIYFFLRSSLFSLLYRERRARNAVRGIDISNIQDLTFCKYDGNHDQIIFFNAPLVQLSAMQNLLKYLLRFLFV